MLSSALQIIVKQTWSGSREMVGRMNWPLGGGVGTGVPLRLWDWVLCAGMEAPLPECAGQSRCGFTLAIIAGD